MRMERAYCNRQQGLVLAFGIFFLPFYGFTMKSSTVGSHLCLFNGLQD